MTTEDLIEKFISAGIDAYKKGMRGAERGRRLDRHQPIEYDGVEFCYWREYTVYRMAEYIRDVLPDIEIEVELCGNESRLKIEVDDNRQQKINSVMFRFLNEMKLL